MPQNRIIWACEAIGFAPLGNETYVSAHGVQSAGITTTFNLEPVFELGQSRLYENIEGVPDVELSMEKVLDGYCPLYLLATRGAPSATLFGRSNAQCIVAMSIFPDTNDSASGQVLSSVVMSGMYANSVSYTFPSEGNCTESVTLIGNEKVWKTPAQTAFSGGFDNTDIPYALTLPSGGVQRRENVLFNTAGVAGLDSNGQSNATALTPCTILPRGVAGISPSGTNNLIPGSTNHFCSISNISVSADFGREAINELGKFAPYCRVINPQVEVTTQIDVISKSGDMVTVTENGYFGAGQNTRTETIKIATQDGLFLDLGTQNRLSSLSETGGDAGGGNRTISYTYSTFNDLTVTHHQDVTTALRPA